MRGRLILTLGLILFNSQAQAAEDPTAEDTSDEEQSSEQLSDDDQAEALDFSQKELQGKLHTAVGLNLGMVMPWSKVGVTSLSKFHQQIASLSLGFGSYEYSGNLDRRNYQVSGDAQSAYLATRYFVMGFGPIYIEPLAGIVHWDGEIKPRGSDDLSDVAASSLTSRYDLYGIDVGANLGLMWLFTNGIFLDYNFMSLSKAVLLKETYTTSTNDARKAVRSQVAGFMTMNSINIRIGYALDF